MPPRVTYWTGVWDPAKEAISREIEMLRTGARSRAPVVAFAPGQSFRFAPRERALVLSGRSWPALRGVAALLEPRGEVTHIFGARCSWHLFRALGRRPILLTAVATHAGHADVPADLAHVVIEVEADLEEWRRAGYPADRISLIRPGVDLEWHRSTAIDPRQRFAVLFASTPSDPEEIDARGIHLLVELAHLRPDIDVLVPWRQWGDVAEARRRIDRLNPPTNFIVSHDRVADMRPWFARAHATVVPFASGVGKSCPSFVVEGFAAGRPCVATPGGLSALIEAHHAGLVVPRTAEALAAAIDTLRSDWRRYASGAIGLAAAEFDARGFRQKYEMLYDRLSRQRQ